MIVPVEEIGKNCSKAVYPIVSSLYERFGIPRLSPEFVTGEIDRFRSGRY